MRLLAAIVLACGSQAVFAQDPLRDLQKQLETRRLEIERQRVQSVAKLRQAIIELRNARQQSCNFKAGPDCLLAELSTAELALLNVEDAYRQAGDRAAGETRRERYKKIQEGADDLRRRVNDLSDLIEASEK